MRCTVPLLKRPTQDSEQARAGFRAAWTLAALAMGLAGTCNQALADQTVVIDGAQPGKQFDGIGAVSAGGATSVLLKDYPETQRRQILDLLFKPNFGASISVLFVEVGGDGNSTQGVELSHMHARDDQNYSRGYEWWLMREARQRNPDLALDACAWSAPAWVGNGQYFSQDMCDYYANWIVGLKEHYGLQLDAVGCRNERGVNVSFAKMFRRTLDARGLKHARIHAFDNWNRDKWDWCRKLETDAELRDSIDILSNHTLSCVYENNGPTPDWVKALADRFHKPIWDTEEHVYLDGYKCELMLVKSLNGNFLDAGATRTVNWYLLDAMYSVEPFKIKPGMLVADSPWSGHYAVREALWGYAHYGQFSKIGWQYLPKACGRLTGGGTYVTLKSPETDYSVILETGGAKARQTVTFKLAGGVSTGRLCVWRSNSREQFVRQPDLEPGDGTFRLAADPDSIYSLSTTTGQGKGSFADIPADRPFPLPYHEPLDGYTPASAWGYLPRYTADISGAFELAPKPDGNGQCLRQITDRRGSNWGAEWNAFTILGDAHWKDYEIACDVTIPDGKGWAGLLGRVHRSGPPPAGYLFRVSAEGTGGLYSTVPLAKKKGQLRQLSEFALQRFDSRKWHRLRLRFSGSNLTAFVDGAQVCQADDKECGEGLAGLIVGEEKNKVRTTACFSDLVIQKPNAVAPFRHLRETVCGRCIRGEAALVPFSAAHKTAAARKGRRLACHAPRNPASCLMMWRIRKPPGKLECHSPRCYHGRVVASSSRSTSMSRSTSNLVMVILCFPALALAQSGGPVVPASMGGVKFVKHRIGSFRSEAFGVADFNGDGKLDIVAGDYLYLAPEFKPLKIRSIKGKVDEHGKGYFNDFMNAPVDVEGKGRPGVVSVDWFSKSVYYYRNTLGKPGDWPETVIDTSDNYECGDLVDLEGKGKATAVLTHTRQTVWFEVGVKDGKPGLVKHVVSTKKMDFGAGVGDINGAGRPDIIRPNAWFEAPSDIRNGQWKEHPLALGDKGGRIAHTPQILVYDVNGDGLNDIIASNAHGYGIFWYEQVRDGDNISWKQHTIDDTWTQAHSLALADLDGCGVPELITGKRFMAHNGGDPDAYGKLGLYYYKLIRKPDKTVEWKKYVISYDEGIGAGLAIWAGDLRGSGRIDVVVTGKFGGPVWFENKGK